MVLRHAKSGAGISFVLKWNIQHTSFGIVILSDFEVADLDLLCLLCLRYLVTYSYLRLGIGVLK